jgi:hypothetical protein
MSDQLATGTKNTVQGSVAPPSPKTGEPGTFAPQLATSVAALTEPGQAISRTGLVIYYQYFYRCSPQMESWIARRSSTRWPPPCYP